LFPFIPPGRKIVLNSDFINSFVDAAKFFFSSMSSISVSPGAPQIKEGDTARGDVSSVIGMTGCAEGTMSLSFSDSCALAVATSMTGAKAGSEKSAILDAVGELRNIVAGDARTRLEKLGYALAAAIPTVVSGKDHTVYHNKRGGPVTFIPFSTGQGDFYLDICFALPDEAAAS